MISLFTLTTFVSAFLLFQVQPLIAKHLLPWYGGGPGVWTACMLFFQVALLLGYGYAHAISAALRIRSQAIVHIALIAISLAFASIAPDAPIGIDAEPTDEILLGLATHVGLPFAVLASTSPLVSHWFGQMWAGRSPYRLYALSNAGSLLALLSYPLAIEPLLSLPTQERVWSIGYVVFAALCAGCAWSYWKNVEPRFESMSEARAGVAGEPSEPVADSLSISGVVLWFGLSATASVLLLATTHKICQDLTVVPLLWILPLALYLASFILCFERESGYRRGVFVPLFAAGALGVTWLSWSQAAGWFEVAVFAGTLFCGAMVCHGELVRIKPAVRFITTFYLCVAAGGAVGGILVGVMAPRIFPGYWEYPLGLLAAASLAMLCLRRGRMRGTVGPSPKWAWAAAYAVVLCVAVGWGWREIEDRSEATEVSRTFYGINRVASREDGKQNALFHGRIIHGAQFTDAKRQQEPTTYFGRDSGVGLAIERYRISRDAPTSPLRVGIVGLGTGTLAAYGRPGDSFRFYEIDPDVVRLARAHFSFLADSDAEVEVVVGDARLALASEASLPSVEKFDLLVLDAFSGDAVPVHLLTREAYAIYTARLRPNGLLVFQVTNAYLDLAALVRGLATDAGHRSLRVLSSADPWRGTMNAAYVLAGRNSLLQADTALRVAATPWTDAEPELKPWTDADASLLHVLGASGATDRWETAPNLGHFVIDRGDFLSAADESQTLAMSRALFDATEGDAAIVVVTAESMKSSARFGSIGEEQFDPFIAALFQRMELARPGLERGLLLFVSRSDRRIGIHVGPRWPAEMRDRAQQILRGTAIAGLSEGRPSEGLVAFVENIDRLIRARAD